jgi:hypothetical protein
MGFTLKQTNSYSWPVSVEIPVDNGRHERSTFDAEFKRIPQTRIKEFGEELDAGTISESDICREVLIGWKGITDDDGKEVKFTQSNFEQLVDVPMVAMAVATSFFNSLAGVKRKNS